MSYQIPFFQAGLAVDQTILPSISIGYPGIRQALGPHALQGVATTSILGLWRGM